MGVLREDWGRQAFQVSGTAAEASKTALSRIAEEARRVHESKGPSARIKPQARPRIEDMMPESVLAETLWLNKVGTLGVASAGYWWGRAGACAIRLMHYMLGHDHAIRALLYSDDG